MAYNVGVIGCGKIFPRHAEATQEVEGFNLVSVCDIDSKKMLKSIKNEDVLTFDNYKQMVDKGGVNFVVIATPNSQHYEQALYCLQNGCDVLIEKPATLDPGLIEEILEVADRNNQRAYCVLQVRLNSCVQNLKSLLDEKVIGNIRGVSLIQRWQRPKEYFSDWRGDPDVGGGTLHECGIHYLDILCYVLGAPKVVSSKKYNTKHKDTPIEDTIYSIIDYGDFGGSVEINIASEPRNLECSLSILTDEGYIRIGGKAMNKIEEILFDNPDLQKKVLDTFNSNNSIGSPNSYGAYSGSCPNHPDLYRRLSEFDLKETKNVLKFIQQIYDSCGIRYKSEKK